MSADNSRDPQHFQLADWLAWMEAHHPRQIELGLDRVRTVAARLHINPAKARVITVAGTNGKGSCVAFLESLLKAHGYRVGAYTSPHLLFYNERVRCDGEPVDDDALCAAFRAVHAALGDTSLTYFEFGTLAALWLFQQTPLDVWVLEVGLGGRLDAVNIIDTDAAVITTIDLDHQDWLGSDRESIGREKAGIFRRDRWAVCVDPQPPASLMATAQSVDARWLSLAAEVLVAMRADDWDWSAPGLPDAPALTALPRPSLPLPSAIAAVTALAALQFPLSVETVRDCLRNTRLAGRFQVIERDGVEVVFDVAHNPQAARGLAQQLREQPVKRTLAVFEIMQDKDVGGIVEPLLAQIDAWYVGGLPDNPRAAKTADLAPALRALGAAAVNEFNEVVSAFAGACADARGGDRIVVFGSFFTVAAVLARLATDNKNAED